MERQADPSCKQAAIAEAEAQSFVFLKCKARRCPGGEESDTSGEDCETPKSEEHKILPPVECPAAPRKPKTKPRNPTISSRLLSKKSFAVSDKALTFFFSERTQQLQLLLTGDAQVDHQSRKRRRL
eukprot:TRINITY_DN1425_c0_g1_i1.p1 TRINITY_DN1425_c0_g1~~TRINITY_DN1425_c0_g1_i1.p1  ORF type:complete len:126 (+),score=21.09 TRINITY_DN1425_c0_g1_i1:187-564(+)